MKIISLNVGLPLFVEYNGGSVSTGIFKSPVSGRVKLNQYNLEGDKQADLSVHGGYSKAVYAYPSEHYEFWRKELPETDLPFGIFGENFTTEGLFENEVCIGDKFSIGTAEIVVTEPRFPCFKLAIRFGRKDILRRFQKSGLSGIYFAVLKIGEVGVGDEIKLIEKNPIGVTVSQLMSLYFEENPDSDLVQKVIGLEYLPDKWKDNLKGKLL